MIDSLYSFIIAFALIIVFVISFYILKEINTALYGATGFELFNTLTDRTLNLAPFVILMIYFGVPISAIVLASMFGSEPIFLIIGFVLLLFSPLIGLVLRDVIVQILTAFNIPTITNNPVIQNAIYYYPVIMFFLGIAIIVVQFARIRSEE